MLRMCCGAILFSVSVAANAVGPYLLDAPVAANVPQAGAALGFSVGAARAPASRVVAAGALGQNVSVYRFAPGNGPLQWQQTVLSDTTDDNFAISVAVSAATREWLAIGANGDDRAVFNAGRVDIYGLDINNNYVLSVRLLSPNPVSTGNYGSAVALDGDLLAVGEPKAARLNDGAEVGAVHLYAAVGNNWLFQTSLYGTQIGGRFGQSVALNAGTLAVGSPLFDDGGGLVDVGALHFFVGSGPTWQGQGTVTGIGRAENDRLGISVAVDGNTAIGGAANDDKVAGADAGSAFVFTRQGSTWTEQARLRSSQPQNQERFAQSVSVAGDEALVGAYCLSPNCIGPGALYVFRRNAGAWSLLQRLTPASAGADSFGHASSYAGGGRAVVGAFGADLSGPADQGAVYGLSAVSLFQNGFE